MYNLKKKNAAYINECKAAAMAKLTMSTRNKKLVPNAKTSFLIWNLPARTTCPYATPHCIAKCYARKAEQVYPSVLPARIRNFKATLAPDFVDRMVYTILSYRKRCKGKKLVVRIHESGDFYSAEYAGKWLEIARRCKGENITFIAYTKSYPYFDGVKIPANFKLRFSVWDDTTAAALDACERNEWPIYTAVEKFGKGDNFTRCRCADCAGCGKCWADFKDIRCEIH